LVHRRRRRQRQMRASFSLRSVSSRVWFSAAFGYTRRNSCAKRKGRELMAVERVEREREREKARGRGVGHALPVAIRNCSSPFSSLRHGLILSLSLSLSLYHARGEEATAAKLRRGEVGPGEHGHGCRCERLLLAEGKVERGGEICEKEKKLTLFLVCLVLRHAAAHSPAPLAALFVVTQL